MGEVWRAIDYVLGREVAIKVLKPQLIDDPQFLERFRREARHTAALTHPGIAQVYDYAEEQGRAYLVMELVPGEPLSAVLAREGSLDVDRTLDIVAQTALALQAAHDAGVVHRDVKPGNVLVTPNGTVKITDFGISRAADGTSLTQTGRVMGTAQYLSPEQAAGGSATPASDLYALGVVTYECLAGRRPFLGKNHVMLAEAHLREQPPPLPVHTPPAVRDLVERLLAKDPADRPGSAVQVSEELTALRLALTQGAASEPEPADGTDTALAGPATARMPVAADADSVPAHGRTGHRRRPARRESRRLTTTAAGHSGRRRPARGRGTRRLGPAAAGLPLIAAIVGLVVLVLIAGGLWFTGQLSAPDKPSAQPTRTPAVATGPETGDATGTGGTSSQARAVQACRLLGQQYTVVRRALLARNVDIKREFAPGPGVPGTVFSVVPCTAREGRTVTVTVVSVPQNDTKPGKGKGKGKK